MATRVRRFCTQKFVRTGARLCPDVENDVKTGMTNAKRHPGRVPVACVQLPERFTAAAAKLLKKYAVPDKETAASFARYLAARQAPVEDGVLRRRAVQLHAELVAQRPAAFIAPLTDEDIVELKRREREAVMQKLHKETYNWQPIKYNGPMCLTYLHARAAPDFAVLTRIFAEIKARVPQFEPKSIFDFGSGIGTVLWAAHGIWENKIREYMAVDVSGEMNEIARLLLQGGHEDKKPSICDCFFRQFLPASQTLKYDLVVSAFSLMELSSLTARKQTLENLWQKTAGFLVIIETGTNAGYSMVMEARKQLLQKNFKTGSSDVEVFSPCSHNFSCPRLNDKIPCNFEVGYAPLGASGKLMERFSYVVLHKNLGSRQPDASIQPSEVAWPRIVSEVLCRPRHVICRLCDRDGQLKEVVVTAWKHGRELYRCARGSCWGDRLPVTTMDDKN